MININISLKNKKINKVGKQLPYSVFTHELSCVFTSKDKKENVIKTI